VPFLRHARDKRGYETTFVMHSFRPGAGQAAGRTRLLYMFRTPSNRKVGRNLLDPEVMEALEHTHPDLNFDWASLTREAAPPRIEPPAEQKPGDEQQRRRERNARTGRVCRHEEVGILAHLWESGRMCRNIRPLFNFDPPATDEEIRAAALQFVRKLSGFTKPSKANEPAFDEAIEGVAQVAKRLMDSLSTGAPARNREEWAARARARAAERYARG